MRYIFILNPNAGKKDSTEKIKKVITQAMQSTDADYSFRVTEYRGHAVSVSRHEASKGDTVRLFACGGDGTLNEVASGAAGYSNAQIGMIPCGSGNDYIKLFGNASQFCDIRAQIDGEAHAVDMIKANDFYSINICSIGFDARVCHFQKSVKRIPLMTGKLSYFLALMRALAGKLATPLRITDCDSGKAYDEEFVFSLATCGRVYGGGYIGAPYAIPNDGLMDVTLFRKASHAAALKLIDKYKKGLHNEIKDYIYSFRSKKIKIQADTILPINIDGEVEYADSVTFESLPGAVNFIIPKGCVFGFSQSIPILREA